MEKQAAVELQAAFTYDGETHPALQIPDSRVAEGRCVVLCGGSGCGKTTLLRCINQLIPQFYEGELKGYCRIGGQDLTQLSIGETGQLAASVFQDPRSQFFTLNSTQELAFGLENFGLSREKMEEKISAAFETFRMGRLRNREVFSLSSGERQLVAILAAWVLDTALFLLDEPTANLDFYAVTQLEEMLQELKKQGKTLVISEHRLYYLRDLADEYWVMDRGQIVQKLTRDQMLALPVSRREALGLRATDLDSIRNQPGKEIPDRTPWFTAENVGFSYPHTDKQILDGLSLTAARGEVLGLIGRNGCGKTTFGKLAAGLLRFRQGSICLGGRVLSQKQLEKSAIFIMQEAEFQFFTNSVLNELHYGRSIGAEEEAQIEELLRSVGLWECRNRHPFSLSGGQMQKLVLLMACLSPKELVILDEPTAGLDLQSLEACADLIRRMQRSKTVLIITHDLELMARVCGRCCAITEGKVEETFDLTKTNDFSRLKAYMQTRLEPAEAAPQPAPPRAGLNPGVKLGIFLLAMIAGIGTDTPLIVMTFLGVLGAFLYERRWKPLAGGACLMGSMYLAYGLFPGVVTAFLVSFFPRVVLICFGALLPAGKQDATGTLAVLRKWHVPEGVLMIISVALRFFPVLRKDLDLMRQSIRTRGFFPGLTDRLRAVPQWLEMMTVPMVFRVIRIAEALSASAETRGIALKNRRQSLADPRMTPGDWAVAALSVVLFLSGLIL